MKESDESMTAEVLQELASSIDQECFISSESADEVEYWRIKILHYLRNEPTPSDWEPFSKESQLQAQVQKFVEEELRKGVIYRALSQDSESITETPKPVPSMAHGSESVNLPPTNAEFLLALFLNKEDQEAAIGCFTELYSRKVIRWGKSRARVWAWVQVGKTLVPALKRVVLKVSGLIAAYEWLRHHLS